MGSVMLSLNTRLMGLKCIFFKHVWSLTAVLSAGNDIKLQRATNHLRDGRQEEGSSI